jgi:23S rRNA pseudouridine2605 synthase
VGGTDGRKLASTPHPRHIRYHGVRYTPTASQPPAVSLLQLMSQIRLQKILSMAGIASRRAAETLISQRRVSVNGHTVAELGSKADPAMDDIRVDGRRVKGAEPLRYLLLHKPRGYVTTRSDPSRRPTVIDLLRGVREYVYPVGRLDYESEGLLLLTNDGDLAAGLTHPRHGLEREYEAWVLGAPDEHDLERLRRGILIDERRTAPATVALVHQGRGKRGGQTLLSITIREGRNRQVRRMCEAIGHPVESLTRVRIGPLRDPKLAAGRFRDLTADEVRRLKAAVAARPSPPARGEPTTRGSSR